jgi:carbon monoxide dehydrogenase subunit G
MVQIVEQMRIEAPSEQVWAVLADLGGVAEWNPTVDQAAATSEASSGLGASRSCAVAGMGTVEETVVAWDEGREMIYDVKGAAMMRHMRAGFALAPVDDGAATLVTMRADFAMRGGPLGALMAATIGRRKLRGTMREVLTGLREHVERVPASERSARPS